MTIRFLSAAMAFRPNSLNFLFLILLMVPVPCVSWYRSATIQIVNLICSSQPTEHGFDFSQIAVSVVFGSVPNQSRTVFTRYGTGSDTDATYYYVSESGTTSESESGVVPLRQRYSTKTSHRKEREQKILLFGVLSRPTEIDHVRPRQPRW
jgi:hypothetical protein